jgi:hypothetical protein
MNFNRKRHKVLELLSKSRIQFDSGRTEPNFKLGVSFDDLKKELECDLDTCELIYSKLYYEKEVEYTDTSVKGLFSTQKGLTSFSEKKYLKENEKIIVNYLRNFVQIAVPILSLTVAILAISLKINNAKEDTDNKIMILKKKLDNQQKIIQEMKQNQKVSIKNEK